MTIRDDLADELTAALPEDVRVTAAPDATDPEPAFDLVVVASDTVAPGLVVANGSRAYGLSVLVVGRHSDPPRSDDHLDALLETVLTVLDDIDWLEWTQANRGTYRDTFPSYAVSVTKGV